MDNQTDYFRNSAQLSRALAFANQLAQMALDRGLVISDTTNDEGVSVISAEITHRDSRRGSLIADLFVHRSSTDRPWSCCMRLERNVHTPNKLSLQVDFHEDGPTFSFLWMGEVETQKSNQLLMQIDKSLLELASPLTETHQHFKGWAWKAHAINDERSFHSAIQTVLNMVAIRSIEVTTDSQAVDRSDSQMDASVGIVG